MRLSIFKKHCAPITTFLEARGFILSDLPKEKNRPNMTITKGIELCKSLQRFDIVITIRMTILCKKRITCISSYIQRSDKGGLISLSKYAELLEKNAFKDVGYSLRHPNARQQIDQELNNILELLRDDLTGTIEGREWTAIYNHPQDY